MDQTITEPAAVAARELRVVFGRLRRRLREVSGESELTPSQASVLSRLDKDGAATASGSTPSSITVSASPPDGKSTRSPRRPPS